MCFYCHKSGNKNIQQFIFPSVVEVHNHWKSNHWDDDDEEQKPFRFYSVDLIRCSVDSCSHRSTFQGLHRHHQEKHAKNSFVAIFNNRCALCVHAGDALHEHACDLLQSVMQFNLYNPIVFTDEEFMELIAVNCEESKQKRKNQVNCIFGSRQKMVEHHQQKHGYDV